MQIETALKFSKAITPDMRGTKLSHLQNCLIFLVLELVLDQFFCLPARIYLFQVTKPLTNLQEFHQSRAGSFCFEDKAAFSIKSQIAEK